MEAWRSVQLQLHRQQKWVKGLAMALLALTSVALVFSYMGTESSQIRSSGLIAFNADDAPQPNLLSRHMANIKQARDAIVKKFWYWDGEDDDGPQVITDGQPGETAAEWRASAPTWDEANQEWSETAQIPLDEPIEGSDEAGEIWAEPSQPAGAAWAESAQASQDSWADQSTTMDAWVETPSERAFQQPADAAEEPWQQSAEQLWEEQQPAAGQGQQRSAPSGEEAVLLDEPQEEELDEADDGVDYEEDDSGDGSDEEGDLQEAEGWAKEAADDGGWGDMEEARDWQDMPQDTSQQATVDTWDTDLKPAGKKAAAAQVEPEWPQQGGDDWAALGAEAAGAETADQALWESPSQALQQGDDWQQGPDAAGGWANGREE